MLSVRPGEPEARQDQSSWSKSRTLAAPSDVALNEDQVAAAVRGLNGAEAVGLFWQV
jgi:hypothetical protein